MSEFDDSEAIETLLLPFPGENPAGEDIREDASGQSLYYRLRDARAEARAAERAADDDPTLSDGPPPQWRAVESLATEALAARGKDIEVACWLTESLCRRQGLAGLAAGAGLLAGLIEGFWSRGLFPAEEADDPEARLAAITGLSGQDREGTLLQPLRKTVLFERPDGVTVTFWDYERSASLAASGTKPGSRSTAGIVPLGELEAAARGGLDALRSLDRDLTRARTGWTRLEEAIAREIPSRAQPSTGRVRRVLESLRQTTARYLPPEAPPASGETEPAAPGSDDAPAGHPQASALGGERLSPPGREALLDEILRIAAVFRLGEPNSPIGFTLEEAVRRARLPWPELLRELVADPAARTAAITSVGMRSPDPAAPAAQS